MASELGSPEHKRQQRTNVQTCENLVKGFSLFVGIANLSKGRHQWSSGQTGFMFKGRKTWMVLLHRLREWQGSSHSTSSLVAIQSEDSHQKCWKVYRSQKRNKIFLNSEHDTINNSSRGNKEHGDARIWWWVKQNKNFFPSSASVTLLIIRLVAFFLSLTSVVRAVVI